MKTKWVLLTATAAVVSGLLYGISLGAGKRAEPGQAAPDLALKDAYGKEFKLSDFKGKIVVLEWLNRGCPVSRGAHEKQEMQKVYKKYAGKGVIWLGIDSTEGAKPEENRVYAAEMSLAYPILHDPDAIAANAYGATNTPHMFVIDKDGKLVYAGAIDDKANKNYVAAALDDLLAGRPVSKPKTTAYGCSLKNSKLAS
jgi:peroxiredoxin